MLDLIEGLHRRTLRLTTKTGGNAFPLNVKATRSIGIVLLLTSCLLSISSSGHCSGSEPAYANSRCGYWTASSGLTPLTVEVVPPDVDPNGGNTNTGVASSGDGVTQDPNSTAVTAYAVHNPSSTRDCAYNTNLYTTLTAGSGGVTGAMTSLSVYAWGSADGDPGHAISETKLDTADAAGNCAGSDPSPYYLTSNSLSVTLYLMPNVTVTYRGFMTGEAKYF